MTEQENDSATLQEPIQEAEPEVMEEPLSRFDVIFWSSMISLVVMAIALSAYHFMLADKKAPALRLGVVDLVSITQKLNDDAREQASVVNLSDDQRLKIIAQYEQGLAKIEPAIKKLSQDCACVILVKATMPVVTDSVSDYTVALQNLVFSNESLGNEASTSIKEASGQMEKP
jgi:hypothetical protein